LGKADARTEEKLASFKLTGCGFDEHAKFSPLLFGD
jgi:hypothetical protein